MVFMQVLHIVVRSMRNLRSDSTKLVATSRRTLLVQIKLTVNGVVHLLRYCNCGCIYCIFVMQASSQLKLTSNTNKKKSNWKVYFNAFPYIICRWMLRRHLLGTLDITNRNAGGAWHPFDPKLPRRRDLVLYWVKCRSYIILCGVFLQEMLPNPYPVTLCPPVHRNILWNLTFGECVVLIGKKYGFKLTSNG